MAASDHLSQPQFYHGSNHDFEPGDVLTPGGGATYSNDWSNPDHSPGKYVYTTKDPWMANHAASRRDDYTGESKVYSVEHTGPVENDAVMDSNMGVAGQWNFKTTSPVRVTGRIQ